MAHSVYHLQALQILCSSSCSGLASPRLYCVRFYAIYLHIFVHGKIYLHSSCEDSNSFLAPRAVVLCGSFTKISSLS